MPYTGGKGDAEEVAALQRAIGEHGRAVCVYQQGKDTSVTGFGGGDGICAGLCYGWLRESISFHAAIGRGGFVPPKPIDWRTGKATPTSRFNQAMALWRSVERGGRSLVKEQFAPLLKRDGLVMERVDISPTASPETVARTLELSTELDVLVMGDRKWAYFYNKWTYANGGAHATATVYEKGSPDVVFFDPNAGFITFNNFNDYGDGMQKYLDARYGGKVFQSTGVWRLKPK
ncbi:MAG: YopT-type cysteine protease domain-containing protein [Planctomycetota bacterium]|jgi:hypothetical protein